MDITRKKYPEWWVRENPESAHDVIVQLQGRVVTMLHQLERYRVGKPIPVEWTDVDDFVQALIRGDDVHDGEIYIPASKRDM